MGQRGGGRGQRRDRRDDGDELIEKVVDINRVAKVVKGGRRFSFTAIVVVGDGKGRVGFGFGRANEVPEAIRKGGVIARRSMFTVAMNGTTIAHDQLATFKASKVVLRAASPGTGLIAGGPARAVLEATGITDVLTKSLGSNNALNVVRATIEGLRALRDPEQVVARRHRLAEEQAERLEQQRAQAAARARQAASAAAAAAAAAPAGAGA
jgi:small subunit ribosomal protein S5